LFYFKRASQRRERRAWPEFEVVLQPIVDVEKETVFGYEALCRGLSGEHYPELVEGLEPVSLRRFDKLAMARALRLVSELRLVETGAIVSLNVGPMVETEAMYIQRVARHYGIRLSSIVLELTEGVRMTGSDLSRTIRDYRAVGIMVAIDDFGAGYAGLNSLAASTPDVLKIDRELIRGIEFNRAKKTILEAFAKVCRRLGVRIVAEGVETIPECRTLQGFGITLMQGHLFAHPAAYEMPDIRFPGRYRRLPRVSREDRMWLRRALRQ
jgi:EAL domain-containing protein (putative c-di-GMP-specific phosphodiesterase class I)